MRPIKRVFFAAQATGRFVLFFDKGNGRFASIEIPFQDNVQAVLARYLEKAAVAFMLPAGSYADVDISRENRDCVTLVFDYEVANCSNAVAPAAEKMEDTTKKEIPGTCGTECPIGSGLYEVIMCEDPVGTDPICGANGVYCG